MLSSLAGRVRELEKKHTLDHERLDHVVSLLGLNHTEPTKPNQVTNLGNNDKIHGETKLIFLKMGAQLKEASFKMNGLMDVLSQHDREMETFRYILKDHRYNANEIRDYDFDENGNIADDDRDESGFRYNPDACEFRPGWDYFCPQEEVDEVSNQGDNISSPRVMDPLNHRNETNSDVSNTVPKTIAMYSQVVQDMRSDQQKPLQQLQQHQQEQQIKQEREISTPALQDELCYYKNRVTELEAELKKKDELLSRYQADPESEEWAQKQDWIEHKMRLLKQDKRRRGETIGKLLRCIDDMKDHGRVNESKVTEGKYVLQATLNTRSWPQEDRIRAAVHALDAEKIAMRAQYEADKAAMAAVVTPDDVISGQNSAQET